MHDWHAAIKREEPRDIRTVEKLPGQAGQVTQAPIAWIKMNTNAEPAIRGEDAPAALEELAHRPAKKRIEKQCPDPLWRRFRLARMRSQVPDFSPGLTALPWREPFGAHLSWKYELMALLTLR
jgi:hypothetical protein